MSHAPILAAVGLMSGTSLDGIDAALIRTDGDGVVEPGGWLSVPYDPGFRARLRACLGREDAPAELEEDLADRHADVVLALLRQEGVDATTVDVIGFHGQTILHRPERRLTRQIGDAARLAERTGIDVVADFRLADVAAGGQGAPFAPLYHGARAANLEPPLAVLNLGGVGNVTWIGTDGAVIAFDTGPGNALIDDFVAATMLMPFDRDGALARSGQADQQRIHVWLDHPFFALPPPKSLDRNDFVHVSAAGLSPADGAATLTAFTAASVAAAMPHLPQSPRRWLVTGGGRHNAFLMEDLARVLSAPVEPVEAVGWRGDALEAEAFAYLAVRSLRGLPLSLPTTTGVPAPCPGGRLVRAR